MTNERYKQLMDALPEIELDQLTDAERAEGWHYCYEFDGLLVGPGMSELQFCGCLPKTHSARKVPFPP